MYKVQSNRIQHISNEDKKKKGMKAIDFKDKILKEARLDCVSDLI